MSKIAILIDGGFFSTKFSKKNGRPPERADVKAFIKEVMALVKRKTPSSVEDSLLRTYYYDCKPFGEKVKSRDRSTEIDMSTLPSFKQRTDFINSLRTMPQMALRLGTLSFTGWKLDPYSKNPKHRPDLRQKGVDMKIGLDIAWIASRKTVDKLVLVTGDADFVSPMKLARREGILVYLCLMGHRVNRDLAEHADFILQGYSKPEKKQRVANRKRAAIPVKGATNAVPVKTA